MQVGDYMYLKRLRDLREDHNLTQKELAEIISCSQRVYSNYECGQVGPSLETLIKICDFYYISVDYLLGRTDNPNILKITKMQR